MNFILKLSRYTPHMRTKAKDTELLWLTLTGTRRTPHSPSLKSVSFSVLKQPSVYSRFRNPKIFLGIKNLNLCSIFMTFVTFLFRVAAFSSLSRERKLKRNFKYVAVLDFYFHLEYPEILASLVTNLWLFFGFLYIRQFIYYT